MEQVRVKVYLDEESGIRYIKGPEHVLFSNNVCVSRRTFDEASQAGKSIQTIAAEAGRIKENRNWDFEKSCATTHLVKSKGAIDMDNLPDPAVKADVTTFGDIKNRVTAFFSDPHSDILFMTAIIGVLSACMSMYHATVFLHSVNGKPMPVALITAFVMVLFAASAFTTARHLAGDNKLSLLARAIFSPTFVALGLGVIWFLVFSTVTVNFTQYTQADAEKEAAYIASNASVTQVQAKSSAKDAEIAKAQSDEAYWKDEVKKQSEIYDRPIADEKPSDDAVEQKRIDARRAVAMSARNAAYKSMTAAQKSLAEASDRYTRLLAEKSGMSDESSKTVAEVKDSRRTAYTVVAEKTGIDADTLKFLVYVIPPAFFDIVSPLAVSVVLLLRDRKKQGTKAVKESIFTKLARLVAKKIDKEEEKLDGTNLRKA